MWKMMELIGGVLPVEVYGEDASTLVRFDAEKGIGVSPDSLLVCSVGRVFGA
jgi:hypothetical protein